MRTLTPAERRAFRAKAHHLHPFVSIGQHGLTPAVLHEIDVNLLAHGLIKVRVFSDERDERETLLARICTDLDAAPVQHLGKILTIWRPAPEPEAEKPAARPRAKPGPSKSREKPAAGATKQRRGKAQSAEPRKHFFPAPKTPRGDPLTTPAPSGARSRRRKGVSRGETGAAATNEPRARRRTTR